MTNRIAKSVVLFDATAPRKTVRRFGAGLTAFVPHSGRVSYTSSDEAEYLAMVAERDARVRAARQARERAAREFNAHLEERAMDAAMMDRACRGPVF